MAPEIALFGDIRIPSVLYNNLRVYGSVLLFVMGVIVFLGVKPVSKAAPIVLCCVIISIISIYVGIGVNWMGSDKVWLVSLFNLNEIIILNRKYDIWIAIWLINQDTLPKEAVDRVRSGKRFRINGVYCLYRCSVVSFHVVFQACLLSCKQRERRGYHTRHKGCLDVFKTINPMSMIQKMYFMYEWFHQNHFRCFRK